MGEDKSDPMLTVHDLQHRLNIGRRQAYEIANREDFPSLRLGRSIRIPVQAFEQWINRKIEGEGNHQNDP